MGVRQVLVVLFADALDEIGVRYERHASLTVHGLVYALGSSIVTSMSMWPMFGRVKRSIDAQRFGPGQAAHVEPGLAVLPDGLDDQRVAFPVADRIAHPGRLRILAAAAGRR